MSLNLKRSQEFDEILSKSPSLFIKKGFSFILLFLIILFIIIYKIQYYEVLDVDVIIYNVKSDLKVFALIPEDKINQINNNEIFIKLNSFSSYDYTTIHGFINKTNNYNFKDNLYYLPINIDLNNSIISQLDYTTYNGKGIIHMYKRSLFDFTFY